MAPAADHKGTQESLNQTFSLTNICPQNPVLNRGLWRKLENYVRDLVQDYGELDIFTGPLFLPKEKNGKKYIKYEVIGDNNVAVPTHFFKLIFYPSGKEPEAYVVPNEPIEFDTDMAIFIESIAILEKISGINFPKNYEVRFGDEENFIGNK